MELDWKRICFRSRKEAVEGTVGEVVIFSSTSDMPSGLQDIGASLPHNKSNTWTIYKERTYVFCKIDEGKIKSPVQVRSAAAKATNILIKEGVSNIVLEGESEMTPWIAEGIMVASYKYDIFHSEKKTQVALVYAGQSQEVISAIEIAQAQNFARFLVDTPANKMTPTLFVGYAKEYLPEGVQVKVYDRKELQSMNMNLLLGVSNGSAEEPKLLEISYNLGSECIALVGKGVTFDSGGISLKPSAKMAAMKGDMGGGASVVSTIGALARLNAKVSVVGIVPLTENLPSGTATKPGDVHVGSAGKSVEVDNTDAEGRLILADALDHALKFNPTKIVDIATLTGAITVSLGPVMAGVFSNCDELAEELVKKSNEVEDKVWRLPVTDEYKSLISSEVADLKNVGGPAGGSITAALFLREFVQNKPWAHLDIAGVAFNTLTPELHGKGATGRPVKLLTKWLLEKQ
ncbi:cytosol aminopeptidase [Nematocida major]|uniref:cytosol aminopeptidase n=1 Tax=Nematocida major TaxID=1912982 RepID=UPI002008A3D3|nr:cytosol aminopeptidase [Nematocida major]KAH9385633.1 cytosol aminopeptidase [Nematocida major]